VQNTVSVLLVDDHAVVRQGYRALLERANISVIAEAESGEEACQLFSQVLPDVVVMDVSMPGIGGLEATRKLVAKWNNIKILVFSMHDDAIYPTRAMHAGARGYVTKNSAPDVLVDAVFAVAQNKKYISDDIAQNISINNLQYHHVLNSLSAREFEVFRMLAQGLSLDEIANIFSLDYKTIANIQTRIKNKLNVETTAQLILAAIRFNVHSV